LKRLLYKIHIFVFHSKLENTYITPGFAIFLFQKFKNITDIIVPVKTLFTERFYKSNGINIYCFYTIGLLFLPFSKKQTSLK